MCVYVYVCVRATTLLQVGLARALSSLSSLWTCLATAHGLHAADTEAVVPQGGEENSDEEMQEVTEVQAVQADVAR